MYANGMPSTSHEAPIELIRTYPELSAELVRSVTDIKIPEEGEVLVTLAANDASNVVPTEFTADAVTLVRSKASGEPRLLIVIEPQGRKDEEKAFAWPAYLANLRAAHRCKEAVLIVVCWNETEAEKCREAIPMGHPGFVLKPLVIGPDSVPGTDDASPWVTLLRGTIGAISLRTDTGRRTVLDAIIATDSSTTIHRKLTSLILAIAPEDARLELEALMATTEYKSDFLDRIEARAEAQGEKKLLLRILRARGIELTRDQRDRLDSTTDPDQIDTWGDRAATATSADDVFKD
jgi:hypothetical protein